MPTTLESALRKNRADLVAALETNPTDEIFRTKHGMCLVYRPTSHTPEVTASAIHATPAPPAPFDPHAFDGEGNRYERISRMEALRLEIEAVDQSLEIFRLLGVLEDE